MSELKKRPVEYTYRVFYQNGSLFPVGFIDAANGRLAIDRAKTKFKITAPVVQNTDRSTAVELARMVDKMERGER